MKKIVLFSFFYSVICFFIFFENNIDAYIISKILSNNLHSVYYHRNQNISLRNMFASKLYDNEGNKLVNVSGVIYNKSIRLSLAPYLLVKIIDKNNDILFHKLYKSDIKYINPLREYRFFIRIPCHYDCDNILVKMHYP